MAGKLSRLNITGQVSINTPKCVLEEIMYAEGIDIQVHTLDELSNRENIIAYLKN